MLIYHCTFGQPIHIRCPQCGDHRKKFAEAVKRQHEHLKYNEDWYRKNPNEVLWFCKHCGHAHIPLYSQTDFCRICNVYRQSEQLETLSSTGKRRIPSERLEQLLEMKDFVGLGNLMFDVLTCPWQMDTPDEDARLLECSLTRILSNFTGAPPDAYYPSPFRDQGVLEEDLGIWAKDTWFYLIITAHALGAARTHVRDPHNKLIEWYRHEALAQQAELTKLTKHWSKQPATGSAPALLEQVLCIAKNDDEDSEDRLRAIVALLTRHCSAAKLTAATDPEDL